MPIVTLTGPRQSGKTTLARATCPDLPYANLEAPDIRAHAEHDPRGFLARYPDGAVLDEVQRVPELLSYLQVLVDEDPRAGRFVLTGSHQLLLDANVSQSLAGRTALLTLMPLSIREIAACGVQLSTDELLFAGGYPRLHSAGVDPRPWLGDYIATYVERDVRQLTQIRDLAMFRRFVHLCAGRIGQLLNTNSLSNDLGISHSTVRHWISLLETSHIVRLVPPWHGNLGKRLIKSAKLYFGDVGLACQLLGIENARQLATHPLRGALFENLVVMEQCKHRWNRGRTANLHFYRDSSGLEVDGVIPTGNEPILFEVKAAATMNQRFLHGMDKLAQLLPNGARARVVVYDGDDSGPRSGAEITNPAGFEAVLDDLDS